MPTEYDNNRELNIIDDDFYRKSLIHNELEEISFLKKVRERLRGYHCGEHKELDKMILNRIKELK